MSIHSKMTEIANKIRSLLGISEKLGLDAMNTNLETANTEVTTQEELMNQIIEALDGKSVGGGNSTYNVEYIVGDVIEAEPFKNNDNIKKVNFPNVTSIGEYAFSDCEALTEVNFPNVTSIGEYAFSDCDALTEVNFPNATSVGVGVFYSCNALTEVNFPNATSVGVGVFNSCNALTKVDFHKAQNIGEQAFTRCTSLKSLILRTTETVCVIDLTAFDDSNFLINLNTGLNNGNIYVPTVMYEYYRGEYEATLNSILGDGAFERIVRKLEDYTVDGTTTGELDESKI